MPQSSPFERTVDEAEMLRFAADVAMALRRGDCLCLYGYLGAGKTTFARALIRALVKDEDQEFDVPSPTFTLVQTYDLPLPVVHADAFRIADPAEADELGLDEALERGIALIEWPERLGQYMPSRHVSVQIEEPVADPAKRRLILDGDPACLTRIRRSMSIRSFVDETWSEGVSRSRLLADASARAYEGLKFRGETRILMDAPRMPDGPPVRDGKPYSQIAHLAEDVTPFVALARTLVGKGFCAPEIYGLNLDEGLVLLEHLGSGSVLDSNGRPVADRYLASVECLAAMHAQKWPDTIQVTAERTHKVPLFDLQAFLIEAELLIDWYCPRFAGRSLNEVERQTFGEIWKSLYEQIGACGSTLILRDFHSPNIIWRSGMSGHDRIGIIDFQDAMIGSPAYDVMSLARDARVDVPSELEAAMLETYIAARKSQTLDFDEDAFQTEAAILAAQRICKIMGIFVRLDERDNKPAYLAHLPRMRTYLARSLSHPVLEPLHIFLADMKIVPEGDEG